MEEETKVCPDCAETIKAAARKCRYCGYEFTESGIFSKALDAGARAAMQRAEEIAESKGEKLQSDQSPSASTPKSKEDQQKQSQSVAVGCLILLACIFSLSFCSGSNDSDTADTAENREKGFHCLSGWDGSHREFVRKVKEQLRDPESFEHSETFVTPNKGGRHGIRMTFRSRNGFGGMTAGTAIGSYSNAGCEASVISIE